MNSSLRPQINIEDLNPIFRLTNLAKADMDKVESLIRQNLRSDTPLICEVAQHLFDAGGKRIRPLMTVVTSQMLGYLGSGHIALAGAVEYIHSATLLHDDVVDNSGLRRGRKPANQIWSNPHSVLVGDFLFARAFMMMVDAGSMEALQVLSRAAAVIAEGEVRQLATLRNITIDQRGYMKIIEAKTAELFAAAARVSPILCCCEKQIEMAMDCYGRQLGLAFQLVDDVLDYHGLATDLGKRIGDDFREGKITLPVVLAIEQANTQERAFWSRTMEELKQDENDFELPLKIMSKYKTLERSLELARGHAQKAVDALNKLPNNIWSNGLAEIAKFVVQRAY